jgi:putative FmdB family regulatory protein
MPLLEFKCNECGAITEKLVESYRVPKYSHVVTCNECGKDARRIISTPAPAQFTGSGFYATDYRGK